MHEAGSASVEQARRRDVISDTLVLAERCTTLEGLDAILKIHESSLCSELASVQNSAEIQEKLSRFLKLGVSSGPMGGLMEG